jgi:UDP:flavonoid glycosyltransferase YjiC (YdhE family)
MNWLRALFFLSVVFCVCQSYKILGVFQIPGRSHYILASKLFKEIANRGHDVTFITPFVGKTKVKNLKEIPIESLQTTFSGKQLGVSFISIIFNLQTVLDSIVLVHQLI